MEFLVLNVHQEPWDVA